MEKWRKIVKYIRDKIIKIETKGAYRGKGKTTGSGRMLFVSRNIKSAVQGLRRKYEKVPFLNWFIWYWNYYTYTWRVIYFKLIFVSICIKFVLYLCIKNVAFTSAHLIVYVYVVCIHVPCVHRFSNRILVIRITLRGLSYLLPNWNCSLAEAPLYFSFLGMLLFCGQQFSGHLALWRKIMNVPECRGQKLHETKSRCDHKEKKEPLMVLVPLRISFWIKRFSLFHAYAQEMT